MTGATTAGQRLRSSLAAYDRNALLLLLPVLLFLLGLFIYPLLYGAQLSVTPESGNPLDNYRRFWADAFFRDTIWLTLRLAVPGTLIVTAIALPLAVLMRGYFRGKHLVSSSLIFPVTLGAVLIGKGLLSYLGPTGWVNRSLLALNIVDAPLTLTRNYWGVLLAIVIADLPFVFLLLLSYASGLDSSMEQAAAVMGAGPRERFWRITLPLLAPGLVTTVALSFVLSFGTFPSALLVGDPAGSTRTIAVVAYRSAFLDFDYSMASAVAIIMAVIELLAIASIFALRNRLNATPRT